MSYSLSGSPYGREVVKSTSQALTNAWADLGGEVLTLGYKKIGVWIKIDINDSQNVRLRALPKLDAGATDEYSLSTKVITATDVALTAQYFEFSTDADGNYFIEIDTSGLIFYTQLQVMAGVVGAGPGNILSCEVTKYTN